MKTTRILACGLALLLSSVSLASTRTTTDDCQTAYQDATYGYQHIKKSFKSYNMDHLREYANRAMEAISKVETSTKNCGCVDANYAAYDAIENMNKALSKETFERSKNFIETAKSNIQSIMVALDQCSASGPDNVLAENEENLIAQEQALLEQQQQLLEQQKKIQAQMAKQKKLQNELAAQKEVKLRTQKAMQVEAEISLQEMERIIQRLSASLGCKSPPPAYERFEKTLRQLEAEPLAATKRDYAEKAREIAAHLITTLERCD